jgi:hypothetical protein
MRAKSLLLFALLAAAAGTQTEVSSLSAIEQYKVVLAGTLAYTQVDRGEWQQIAVELAGFMDRGEWA